jgi:hypothetical protein
VIGILMDDLVSSCIGIIYLDDVTASLRVRYPRRDLLSSHYRIPMPPDLI